MVKWLQYRGSYIKNEKWEKLDAIEQTIYDALHEEDPERPGEPSQKA